jgi:hypothetical protein
MISGRKPLPWEAGDVQELRTLKNSVRQCLSRSAAARPSSADLCETWRNLLDFAAVKHTVVGDA